MLSLYYRNNYSSIYFALLLYVLQQNEILFIGVIILRGFYSKYIYVHYFGVQSDGYRWGRTDRTIN